MDSTDHFLSIIRSGQGMEQKFSVLRSLEASQRVHVTHVQTHIYLCMYVKVYIYLYLYAYLS